MLGQIPRSGIDFVNVLDAQMLLQTRDVHGAKEIGPTAVDEQQLLLVGVDDEAWRKKLN